jgi:hypothetical protein
MQGDDDIIDPVAHGIKSRLPDLKVGVNYLTMPADKALKRSLEEGHDATWTDAAGIHSEGVMDLPRRCAELLEPRPEHKFFAGVAFKYQRAEPNPVAASLMARDFGFIPTTSGEATGQAPGTKKLADMREGLGTHPLAIASGITPENVGELGRYLSHILVATGISKTFHDFDEEKLRTLMANLPDRIVGASAVSGTWPDETGREGDLAREVRAAFFDDYVPRKNVALRKAYDALMRKPERNSK